MQPEIPKFRQWLAAERDAHLAERELHEAMLQFAGDMALAPTAQAVLAVRAKRARAHALFEPAMQELKSLAASIHVDQPTPAVATGAAASNLHDPAFHTRPDPQNEANSQRAGPQVQLRQDGASRGSGAADW